MNVQDLFKIPFDDTTGGLFDQYCSMGTYVLFPLDYEKYLEGDQSGVN